MKVPLVSVEQAAVSQYLGKLKFINRFIRSWGTQTVNGVEVLRGKNWYYGVSNTTNARATAKLMGFLADISNVKMKGVSSAWLYLNPAKGGLADISTTLLSDAFNAIPTVPKRVTTTTGVRTTNVISTTIEVYNYRGTNVANITTPISNQPALISEIKTEYGYMFNTYASTSTAPSDGYLDTLSRYALLDPALEVNVVMVRRTVKAHQVLKAKTFNDLYVDGAYTPGTSNEKVVTVYVPTYSIQLDIIDPMFTDTNLCVVSAVADRNLILSDNPPARVDAYNKYLTRQQLDKVLASGVAQDPVDENQFIQYFQPYTPTNPLLWEYDVTTRMWYLKLSTIKNGSVLSLDERIKFLGELMDSDYSEKSRNWWESALLLIVVAVAIYFGGPQAGAKASATIVAATSITAVALALSIYSSVMDAIGYELAAMEAGRLNQTIAPIVKIASIVIVVNSVYKAFSAGTVTGTVATNKLAVEPTTIIGKFNSTITSSTFKANLDLVMKVASLYQENKLAELQEEIKSNNKKAAELEEANEASKYSDIAKLFSRSYTEQITRDDSLYAFDRAYEPTGGSLHIGNIQATSVSAMWLSDDMV